MEFHLHLRAEIDTDKGSLFEKLFLISIMYGYSYTLEYVYFSKSMNTVITILVYS